MKPYVFGIGVVLMLAFSLTGLSFAAAGMLRKLKPGSGRMLAFASATASLVVLLTAIAWSVPPRG